MAGVWSAGSNVGYSTYAPYAGGSQASAFSAGGGATANATCREWNGSAWGAGGSLLNVRTRSSVGDCGDASNAIVSGGYTGSSTYSTSMYYNGTSWTGYGTMTTARWSHLCAGNGSDALITSGANNSSVKMKSSEIWNGSTWSSSSDYVIEHIASSGGGGSTDCIVAAGLNTSTYQATCQAWNGSAWSGKASLSMARHECGGGGSSAHAVIFGGRDTAITANTEEFNGSTWDAGGNMNTARRLVSGGASISGSSGSGISIAGYTTTTVQTVETYAWTVTEAEEIIRSLSSNRQSSSGRLYRFDPKLMNNPPIVLTTPTYDGSGQAVHPSVRYVADGFGGYRYWMGMTPYPNGNDDYENPSLLASNDGIIWLVPSGITNPLAAMPPSGGHNCDSCIIFDGTSLYYYYCKWISPVNKIQRITINDDPLTVGSNVECTLEGGYSGYAFAPTVIRNASDDWIMWFVDEDLNLSRYVSVNGTTWTNRTIVSIFTNGQRLQNTINPWHFTVEKIGDKYLFICCCYPVGSSNAYTDLYWAVADRWDSHLEFNSSALLTEFTGWGSREVYCSMLCQLENGTWRLYISAATSTPTWRIGYADISLF